MLGAVKSGALAGIYKEDQQVPALRARRVGTSWWLVIPKGEDAALFLGAAPGEAPMIVFRDGVRSNAARLDPALRKAWASFVVWRGPGSAGGGGDRCRIATGAGPLSAEVGGPGGRILANVVPRLLCQVAPARTLPAGLRLLQHFHVPAPLPELSPRTPVEMSPAAMNPGFVNPATDTLARSADPSGLDQRLRALITGKHGKNAQRISVALVDLTGVRLFLPEFAGWRETEPVVGGSTPKICALYAFNQLCFDVRTIARRTGASTTAALDAAVRKAWNDRGLTADQPDLSLLTRLPVGNGAMAVAPTHEANELVRCTFTENENRAASLLIARIGLPYISSLLWQSGLFHPTRGGLWLTNHYGTGCTHGGPCCFLRQRIASPLPGAVSVRPSARTTHNLTALSAATFFTLLAQGRLADPTFSGQIEGALQTACTFFGRSTLRCTATRMPAKCGITESWAHDCALVERAGRPDCGGPPIRYAVAVTTRGFLFSIAGARAFLGPLLRDLDALVAQNNPGRGP
jgi:hypothetical protein